MALRVDIGMVYPRDAGHFRGLEVVLGWDLEWENEGAALPVALAGCNDHVEVGDVTLALRRLVREFNLGLRRQI